MPQKHFEVWELLGDEEQSHPDERRAIIVVICIIASIVLLPFLELFTLE